MIRIKVPATSANFCIGFDICGIAFNLYNTFDFEESKTDKLEGFLEEFLNENNLVLTSYKKFFNYFNLEYKPVSIKLVKQEIPESRGLGSSATCIVSGVLAANIISKANKSKEELLNLMSIIEGHPDNVAPAYLGGFISSFKNNDKYESIRYNVSDKFIFKCFIPNFTLSTESARKVLPKEYKISDVISNMSRIIHLPLALESGNYILLKELLNDKIHEPYRIKLIPSAYELIEDLDKQGAKAIISGSGSTILGISDKDFNTSIKSFHQHDLLVDLKGASVECLK